MPPFYILTFATVSVSVSKTFGLKKSLGIGLENIWSQKKVSVSVSQTFGIKKKSRNRSRKYLVSKKSLGIGLDEIFWSRHSVFGSQLRFPHMGQFWVMGVLAGIGTEDPPERGIIRDKHTWHHSPPAQWMG